MKIIKLNLLLLIVLAFCLGCSTDNSSLEEEEQIVLVKDVEVLKTP